MSGIILSDQARKDLEKSVVEKFVRYASVGTQSKEDVEQVPSTKEQFILAKMLEEELKTLGLKDVTLDEHCYVYATLPSNKPEEAKNRPVFGLIAHVDTSPAVAGSPVKPIIHRQYQGGNLPLPGDPTAVLNPQTSHHLKESIGDDIITSDGSTLLGADDKAGVAAIMAAVEYLMKHPEIPHGTVKVGFTPDEEVGRGADFFDVKRFGANFAYTIDGEMEGELNDETFSAASATVTFHGKNVHPGFAKNIMINSLYALSHFLSLFPKDQRPETTEHRQGYLHPYDVVGREEISTVKVLIRDFDDDILEKRKKMIEEQVAKTRTAFPDVKIDLAIKDGYRNMRKVMKDFPFIVDFAEEAMNLSGVKPVKLPIRGGTDGSRLTFMGLPCANIFTGAENFHSRLEWVSARTMMKSAETIIYLTNVWFEKGASIKI